MTKLTGPSSDVVPMKRTRDVAAPVVECPDCEPVARPRRRYAKGDGMTGEKPQLPSVLNPGVPRRRPVGPPDPRIDWQPSKADRNGAASQAKIPKELLPITAKNAEAFRDAFKTAFKGGEPWAKALFEHATDKVTALEKKIQGEMATMKMTQGGAEQYSRKRFLNEIDKAAATGAPWAQVVKIALEGNVGGHGPKPVQGPDTPPVKTGDPKPPVKADGGKPATGGKVPNPFDGGRGLTGVGSSFFGRSGLPDPGLTWAQLSDLISSGQVIGHTGGSCGMTGPQKSAALKQYWDQCVASGKSPHDSGFYVYTSSSKPPPAGITNT